MKRLCKYLGHRWHPEAAQYYCLYDCTRCGHEGYEATLGEQLWVRWALFKERARDRLRYYRPWRQCSECGKRWGRHNDAIEHLPF